MKCMMIGEAVLQNFADWFGLQLPETPGGLGTKEEEAAKQRGGSYRGVEPGLMPLSWWKSYSSCLS